MVETVWRNFFSVLLLSVKMQKLFCQFNRKHQIDLPKEGQNWHTPQYRMSKKRRKWTNKIEAKGFMPQRGKKNPLCINLQLTVLRNGRKKRKKWIPIWSCNCSMKPSWQVNQRTSNLENYRCVFCNGSANTNSTKCLWCSKLMLQSSSGLLPLRNNSEPYMNLYKP